MLKGLGKHFRLRTPEEDIATFDREPHAHGPLGMAVVNIAGFYVLKPGSPELLAYAGLESAVALGGVAYVRYRFRRGVRKTPVPHNQEIPEYGLRGFIHADVAPFVGVAGFTGAVQGGIAASLDMLGVNQSPEAISLGGWSAVGLVAGAFTTILMEGRAADSSKEVEIESPIC